MAVLQIMKITANKLHFKTQPNSFDNYAHVAETKSQISRMKVNDVKKNSTEKNIILGDKTLLKKRARMKC